jgi:hypothetical protein
MNKIKINQGRKQDEKKGLVVHSISPAATQEVEVERS